MIFTTRMVAMGTLLVGLTAGCAKTDADMQPLANDKEIQQAVLGKWRIERVDNKLCRSGNCTSVVYKGTADDFFEFKADSAFLQRSSTQASKSIYRDQFKVDYTQAGGFVLSNFGWSARFKVLQREQQRLVLESTYTGYDPNAAFTDTYYLFR